MNIRLADESELGRIKLSQRPIKLRMYLQGSALILISFDDEEHISGHTGLRSL